MITFLGVVSFVILMIWIDEPNKIEYDEVD